MLEAMLLRAKRMRLMRHFRRHEIKFRAQYLGQLMANAENEDYYARDRERLQEAIQEVCAKKDLGDEDMNLVEEELNDYINGLVRTAFEAESKKNEKRELVDGRVKIKRVEH